MSDILPNGQCRSACFQLNAMMLLQEGYGLENKRLGQLQVQGLDFVQESPLHAVRSILHHALGRPGAPQSRVTLTQPALCITCMP